MLKIFVSYFQPNFWVVFLLWFLRGIERKLLCKAVVSEICGTSLGKIQMPVWFNPFRAVALNHSSCCWHPAHRNLEADDISLSAYLQVRTQTALNCSAKHLPLLWIYLGNEQGLLLWELWQKACCAFFPWNKLSSRSCCIPEYRAAGTFPLVPSSPGYTGTHIREPKAFIYYWW